MQTSLRGEGDQGRRRRSTGGQEAFWGFIDISWIIRRDGCASRKVHLPHVVQFIENARWEEEKIAGSKRWDVLVAVNKFMGIINNDGRQQLEGGWIDRILRGCTAVHKSLGPVVTGAPCAQMTGRYF